MQICPYNTTIHIMLLQMTDPEFSMPTQCPEGFDFKVWEATKDKELEDNFLLLVARELKDQNCPISDVCKCLNLELGEDPRDDPNCHDFHNLLSRWRHNTAAEIVQVGTLICTLSPLQCESLSKLCKDFFRTEGVANLHACVIPSRAYMIIIITKFCICRKR